MPLLGIVKYTSRIGKLLDSALQTIVSDKSVVSGIESVDTYLMAIGFGGYCFRAKSVEYSSNEQMQYVRGLLLSYWYHFYT